jgi:hypothetical protein
MKHECPFKPVIHETKIVQETRTNSVNPVEDRLINCNKNKTSERERIKRHVEDIEQKSYSYKPVISEVSEKITVMMPDRDKPIHQRLDELNRKKNDGMTRLRLEVEETLN